MIKKNTSTFDLTQSDLEEAVIEYIRNNSGVYSDATEIFFSDRNNRTEARVVITTDTETF